MIGRIYKIVHSQSNICYVGSTRNTLVKRWGSHKHLSNKCCIKKYFEKYGFDQFKIMLIKEYEVVDDKHLKAYEQLWISKLSTIEQTNTFRIERNYRKQYYQDNKERIARRSKSYRTANPDIIRERKKAYYESNKEKIKEHRERKYTCECGSELTIAKRKRHQQTKKHLNFISSS